jgi:predicted small lipoprotein YifL
MRAILVAFLLAALAACGDGKDPCEFGTADEGAQPAPSDYRNPETGACEARATSGGPGTEACREDDEAADYADREAPPDWGTCEHACEAYAEDACLDAVGCRAIYRGACAEDASCGPGAEGIEFAACWPTAPASTTSTGDCGGLGALDCSRHDNCAAVHADADGAIGAFTTCTLEALGCYGDGECALDRHCTAVDECLPPPGCDGGDDCLAVCWGMCEPGPRCDASGVTCEDEPPACEGVEVPSVVDGCWSGICVDVGTCFDPPDA